MLWSRRNWERIHTLEKLNHPLYYPIQALPDRKSLFDVMKDAILSRGQHHGGVRRRPLPSSADDERSG